MPIPRQFMPFGNSSDELFIIQASGRNMEPKISNNDYLLCVKIEEVHDGDIVILQKGKKKFHCKYHRKLKDRSFYEDSHKNIFDHQGYKVVGRVCSIFKNNV